MDVSWDADNFEPKLPTTLTTSNKWEGEDEEEIVKESWEDEEEEKKDEEKTEVQAPPPPKPKKRIQDKIAEKERLEREKADRLSAEKVEELTPEQKLAEKLRAQKLQEESDLRLAMETFGVTEANIGKIDGFQPTTKAEFTEFADMLTKKICLYKAREEFPTFIDEFIRNIVVQLPSADIKRIKMSVDNLYIEKQKSEKMDKSKKPTKGKGKAKLKVEGDNAHLNQYDSYGNFDDDYDDFM
ncbi:eukaryotic translation initiation factor 3 subunit J [Spodoptera frugiperda]|uniref:Eukaryotic translation initiation factor 3 subunit J n=2 Tax=Spodoptera frugiperda TaxID=7108 RepID=A0A9R0EV97_SPOFR|nr:eukaryotic translation initiation factor 3 subunit J [Spodoptera frugiperda]